MGFADLPTELLQNILNHAITVRGIKRGMRLRLVNSRRTNARHQMNLTIALERFAAEVINTIDAYRMLDERFSRRLTPGRKLAIPPFTASYIEYRIHNNEDASEAVPFPRLGFLRRIARDLVAEHESLGYDDCIRILCDLVTQGGAFRVYQVFCPALSLPTAFYDGDEYYSEFSPRANAAWLLKRFLHS